MRRQLEDLAWDDSDIARQLDQILHVMEDIEGVWPCLLEIKDAIIRAREKQTLKTTQPEAWYDMDFTPHFFPLTSYM